MGPRASRLLFWGMVGLAGCGSATDDASGGLGSASAGSVSAAGSGGAGVTTPPAAGGAGTKAAVGGSPAAGTAAATAGRSSPGTGGGGSVAAASGNSGSAGKAGAAAGGAGAAAAGSGGASGPTVPIPTEKFSFFVTSLEAMRELSGSENGFGGDLRHGEATGLAGADKICSEIAETSMPGSAGKVWHAFLSAKAGGPSGAVVHAKDRIGKGPWYDRTGRVIAMDLASLLETRPGGADPSIADNLPNERGEPNRPNEDIDNHDTMTGSDEAGQYSGGSTCEDWTTVITPAATGSGGGRGNSRGPMCGHSWPAQSGQSWIKAHGAPGCAASVSLVQMGGGSGDGVGNSGGYGGIYCFALSP